jgi:hypothetical protein
VYPLYNIPKKDVRRLAQHYALPAADRAESMGVCFIGERGRFGDFISTFSSPSSSLLLFVPISPVRIRNELTTSSIYFPNYRRESGNSIRRDCWETRWNVVLYHRSGRQSIWNGDEDVCCEERGWGGWEGYSGCSRLVSQSPTLHLPLLLFLYN